jgi:cobalt-precorrin-5B (C1)-methyltransferase
MNRYVIKNGRKLRTGYTTGSCAAAAVKAGAMMLLGGGAIDRVRVTLPSEDEIILEVGDVVRTKDGIECSVVKDGGDDPDATHGLRIGARVRIAPKDVLIRGGEGVGRVTRPGLACTVGEAAINPMPRKMMVRALEEISTLYNYRGGFDVEIFVPGGTEAAEKTFNSRLGIVGGISILGTTGIVEPMSEAAIVETIRLEIHSREESDILFAAPGNYGIEFARSRFGLDIGKAVKCSNFIGEMLDFAVYYGFKKLLLIGHIGKLVKLAAGVMNTHSKTADCRNEIFAAHAALCGADGAVIRAIMDAEATGSIHAILTENGIGNAVYESILARILFHLRYRTGNALQCELVVFSNESGILMQTEHAEEYIRMVKEC